MDTTQNLNLRKPAGSDYYNVADQNYNMDILDSAVIGTDVRNICKITKTAFDALTTKNSSTIYLVTDSGTVQEYLGNTPIGLRIVELTQAQYDALQTHDANTLYAITGGSS